MISIIWCFIKAMFIGRFLGVFTGLMLILIMTGIGKLVRVDDEDE